MSMMLTDRAPAPRRSSAMNVGSSVTLMPAVSEISTVNGNPGMPLGQTPAATLVPPRIEITTFARLGAPGIGLTATACACELVELSSVRAQLLL